jgi:oligoendopeptidase F
VHIDKGGVNEEAFGVFMHELGHSTEQVLTSYEMDHKSLWSVPNTAFTEGFAFTFQDKADFILGRKMGADEDVTVLQRFWEVFEIAGPSLTEIRFFHWLYDHPEATAADMHAAIRRIGDGVWAEFYARVFGAEGHGLMSVYSHILWCDFYLADYSMGYVIAYQVRKFLAAKKFAPEMERLCALGSIYPESWMKAAVGQEISAAPLLRDAEKAFTKVMG